jgi:hypothetical protein
LNTEEHTVDVLVQDVLQSKMEEEEEKKAVKHQKTK